MIKSWAMISSVVSEWQDFKFGSLRTEVRGDFKIYGTKYFQDAVFHQMPENTFSVITSRVNISCRGRVAWSTKFTGGLKHHNFLIFDGKQNIWFHGFLNHP